MAGALLALSLGAPGAAQPCRSPACAMALPNDSGAVNVRDFGAKGDGKTDDTAALLAAITASGPDTGVRWWHDRVVFLPAGTYLVSDTIVKRYHDGRFGSGLSLQGEGPGRTAIRLADHAAGFQDRAAPRGIIMTTSKLLDTGGSRDYVHKGEGNDAYENFVENMTVDTGEGNPGAIGIDYLANNLGAIRNVVVQAHGDSGAIGIAMLRQIPGPALIQATQVKGFRTGIALRYSQYGMTLSDVELDDQGETGLLNDGNVVSAERLKIVRPGKTALVNQAPGGLVTLVDSDIDSAVVNHGTMMFRRTRATLPGPASHPTTLDGVLAGEAPFRRSTPTWSVPRVSIAPVDPGPSRNWVGVTGSTEDRPVDGTQALQTALNSGASTIYLRHGAFWISATLRVPASVHRIVGMSSTLRVFPERNPAFSHDAPMLLVSEPGGPLEIDRLAIDNTGLGGQLGIRHESARPLLLRDIVSAGVILLDRTAKGGPTALEDVCCGPIQVTGSKPMTVRQLNTEGEGVRVENRGAPLSIIGLKTEQESTVVHTSAHGRTEILGGLVYLVGALSAKAPPIFVSSDAYLAASFAEEVVQPGHGYRTYLRQENAGRVEQIDADAMPARGLGHIVGMLSAGPR